MIRSVLALMILLPSAGGGECRTLNQRFKLGPGDVGVDAAAEPAIGRGNDPLATDEVGKAQDAIGDQLGVFDNIGRVADNPGISFCRRAASHPPILAIRGRGGHCPLRMNRPGH